MPSQPPTDLRRPLEIHPDVWRITLTVALVLTLLNYFGTAPNLVRFFPHLATLPRPELALYSLLWWAAWSSAGYLLVPALLLKLEGRSLADHGFRLPRRTPHLWIYPLLFLAMIAPLALAAKSPAFLRTYPFYHFAASHPRYWLLFELAYGVQFLALEFFFRGFLVFGLHPHMGDASILVSTIPYCMIHFQKPFPECLGAIVAGIVLGFLALRTRSIAGGVVLHWAVALTMDCLAVLAKAGRLPW